MLNINPKSTIAALHPVRGVLCALAGRVTPSKLLESKYFEIPLIQSMIFLESSNIKDTNEKDIFFKCAPLL